MKATKLACPLNTALNTAYSWLTGWGVEVKTAGNNVLVCDGLKVGVGGTDSQVDITLDATKLKKGTPKEIVDEMYRVTRAIGKGEPPPPRDLAKIPRRARSADYEAISMRLNHFAKGANPPDWLLKKYEPVVAREARRAARRYYATLASSQQDVGDLWTIGMILLCGYLGRYQYLDNERRNGANLTHYLRQEYTRWATVTKRHNKKAIPGLKGVPCRELISSPAFGAEIDDKAAYDRFDYCYPPKCTLTASYQIPMEEILSQKAPLPRSKRKHTKQEEKDELLQERREKINRRKQAVVVLEKKFESLTEEQQKDMLQSASTNECLCHEARNEARRRLRKLVSQCSDNQIGDVFKKLSER